MRVHVVKTANNIKLNPDKKYLGRDRIFTLSFPPIETCRPDAPCTRICFAKNSMLRYKGAQKAWGENLLMYEKSPENFWAEVRRVLNGCHELPYLFRFFVGGDFVRPEMVQEIIDLAKEYPTVLFMAFTKRTEWLPLHNSLPMNLSILSSMWPDWTPEGPHVEEYSRCWLDDPENYDDRIPEDTGFPCGEDCVDCKVCYHVRETPTEVILEKHTNGIRRRVWKKQAEALAGIS